jgi:hypothetical protein
MLMQPSGRLSTFNALTLPTQPLALTHHLLLSAGVPKLSTPSGGKRKLKFCPTYTSELH